MSQGEIIQDTTRNVLRNDANCPGQAAANHKDDHPKSQNSNRSAVCPEDNELSGGNMPGLQPPGSDEGSDGDDMPDLHRLEIVEQMPENISRHVEAS